MTKPGVIGGRWKAKTENDAINRSIKTEAAERQTKTCTKDVVLSSPYDPHPTQQRADSQVSTRSVRSLRVFSILHVASANLTAGCWAKNSPNRTRMQISVRPANVRTWRAD